MTGLAAGGCNHRSAETSRVAACAHTRTHAETPTSMTRKTRPRANAHHACARARRQPPVHSTPPALGARFGPEHGPDFGAAWWPPIWAPKVSHGQSRDSLFAPKLAATWRPPNECHPGGALTSPVFACLACTQRPASQLKCFARWCLPTRIPAAGALWPCWR